MKLLKTLRRWLGEKPPPKRKVFYTQEPPPPARNMRPWTGEGSLTEYQILYHLQFGPMTRQELNEVLDVTATGIHLPRLIDRHKVRIVKGTWPFRYELADNTSVRAHAKGEPG